MGSTTVVGKTRQICLDISDFEREERREASSYMLKQELDRELLLLRIHYSFGMKQSVVFFHLLREVISCPRKSREITHSINLVSVLFIRSFT
jgi:hypothetical protein